MATHSKICPLRLPSPPLSQQNQRILGNPFPLTHPCARPRREKTCRFYVCLRFELKLSFGLSHRHLCCGCKISVALRQTTFFWFISSPNQATYSTFPHNQSSHKTFLLVHQQNIICKKHSTDSKEFPAKNKNDLEKY